MFRFYLFSKEQPNAADTVLRLSDNRTNRKWVSVLITLYIYKVPLRDVVGLKSRGCRKWKGGASSSDVAIYPEGCCCNPYYKMRFDDVFLILNLFAEMWSWSHVSTVSCGEHLNGRRLKYVSSRGFTVLFPGHLRLKVRQWRVPCSRIRA